MFKKILVVTALVLGLAVSSFAGNNSNSTSFYNADEAIVSLGTSYSVNNGFDHDYAFNSDVGLSYFVNQYVGIDTVIPFFNDGVFTANRIALGATVRCPFGRVAPYGGAGTVYNWQGDDFDAYGKVGLAYRLNNNIEVFTEYRYTIQNLHNDSLRNGDGQIRGGISLVF